MKTSQQIRQAFIDFWTSPPRNAQEVPNVSLVPNVDSTLLFVNSGMFPLNPYLAGQPHPLGTRLANIQRCLRTKADEIAEIGDNRHTLMFEMMGNWSLGDFFKQEQLPWMLELYVEKFGLDPNRLYVSVWAGDDKVGRDDKSIELWKQAFRKYGIEAEFSEDITQIPESLEAGEKHNFRIFPYGKSDNWWERAFAPGELGGPTSEIFYDMGEIEQEQDEYHINDDSGRFIEIGNSVFMQYKLSESLEWEKLEHQNVDFGGGFERTVMCIQDKKDIFETDIYLPVIARVEEISGKQYKLNGEITADTKYFRIVADHGRIATFLIADGVIPSGKDQGYILRRFIRRLVRMGMNLGIDQQFSQEVAKAVIENMEIAYPHLKAQEQLILETLEKEESKFRSTLDKGLREVELYKIDGGEMNGKVAFYIYETFGFPVEMTIEEMNLDETEAEQLLKEFEVEQKQHREQSRAGAQQKFAGGLADHSEEVVKLHTTHHLLLKALQMVLGEEVKQRGSNITGERLRMDFSYGEKLTEEQVSEVERIVNEQISAGLNVFRTELDRDIAEGIPNIEREFGQTYPEIVSVYSIGLENRPEAITSSNVISTFTPAFSIEFCGGPHVDNTSEIGANDKHFKIVKQESSGAGIRRIKAKLISNE